MSEGKPNPGDGGLEVELRRFSYRVNHGRLPVLENVAFTAPSGRITVIMGRSGCGKTTLLRLLCAIEPESTLSLRYANEEFRPPHQMIGLVFQDYRLFPWKTVEENILCAARATGDDSGMSEELIREFGLGKLRGEWPKTLSGGEQARVALARCLVQRPKIVLLDEVFRSLDLRTRLGIFEIVHRLTTKHHLVTIAVTHDVDEARRMAERVVVLKGRPATVGRVIRRQDGDGDGAAIQRELAVELTDHE